MELYAVVVRLLVFIFGLIIGSFLNVVIYRFGSGMRVTGRSKCLSCGKTLTVAMLIPLLSFLFMRGRCGYCGTKLSWQYPLVETLTGALFVIAAHVNGLFNMGATQHQLIVFAVEAVIWEVLVVITVYDLKHRIIPDLLSLLFALLSGGILLLKWSWGLSVIPFLPFLDSVPVWINAAAGLLLALPFALLWLLSGGRAMGLGDAKLAWGIGWFLGFAGGVSAAVLAFWVAFFPSLLLLLVRSKHFTMKSEIPFAPFLIIGTLIVYTFDIDILSWTF